jgi:hypothetical protein
MLIGQICIGDDSGFKYQEKMVESALSNPNFPPRVISVDPT